MFDRYLVTKEDSLNRIKLYLQAIMKGDPDGFSTYDDAFKEIFPKLAVVFTKSMDEEIYYDDEDDDESTEIKATIHKPVNMHILLTASATSSSTTTTFLGARVLPSVPPDGPRIFERLTKLSVQRNTSVRQSDKAFVFPADTDVIHHREAGDYHLSLHVATYMRNHPEVLPRTLKPAKETVEALLSAIPARKQSSEYRLCQIKISCNEHEFKMLCETISGSFTLNSANSRYTLQIVPCLKDHVGILLSLHPPQSRSHVPSFINFPSFELLKKPMAAVAEQYVAAWGKLGPIRAGQDFFRVQFTNHDEPVYPDTDDEEDEDEDEDRYRRRKYMNIVCLTTPPATGPTLPGQPSIRSEAPKGFDLVVKRVEMEDGDDWYDADGATVVSSKRYPVQ
jgi:hypothetical protein